MSPPTLSLVIMIIFIGLLTGVAKANPEYLYHVCPNTTTFSPNSTYQSNLTAVLSTLISSNATRSSAAASSGAVHAQFLCRGDVNSTVCQDCVEFAAEDAIKRCPIEQEIMIWYDECQLRYSNRSFLGVVSRRPGVALFNTGEVNEADQERFNRLLNQSMSETVVAAARAEDRFATVEADFSGLEKLYTLAQCTPDLSSGNCSQCLSVATGGLPSCCAGKRGGRVLFPNCNVRYEFYPFYDLPPGPLSPAMPPNSVVPLPVSRGNNKISHKTIAAIVVPIAVCLVLFFVGFCLLSKRAKWKFGATKNGNDITTIESLQFTFATIEAATNKFSPDNKLGEGGFGEVYKGTLSNGQLIAVKRLSKGSGQGTAEFKNEVVLLANLQHRNLVRLFGFCLEGDEKLLIYECVPNKSLDYFLYDPEKNRQLDWSKRHNIIGGIARGMLYLHEDSQLRIIHRDLKASNVLLDGDMNAKISDFGMAKMFEVDQTRGNTNRIVGTYGYMSPEYAMQGQFSVKSDVYSFGVLILELISGKKNSSFYESGYAEDLLSYAWKLWNEGIPLKLVDPILGDSYSEDEVRRCINVGLLCVQEDPEDRPTMKTIVLMFNSDSVSLVVPERPAFFNNTEGDKTIGHKFDDSTTSGYPQSVNEVSITELHPR